MAKENGQVEEADMMEDGEIEKKINEKAGKDDNKKLDMVDSDPETGRPESEEDGEGGTSQQPAPKTKKSNASSKKHEGADEEDEEDMDEGELPPALKKAIAAKKGKGGDDDEEDMEEGKMSEIDAMVKDGKSAEEIAKELKLDVKAVKKTLKNHPDYKEEIEVNVDEDVAALVDGEELSETFKAKAATIFEAAVKSKISKIRKQIREESKKEQDERVESMQVEMTENMDKYLNYATQEWMTENKLSVEAGVRSEVTESFITGLKKLFEEHYIDVPEEKEDVFESLVVEVAELEEKLDAQTDKHMDTLKELNTYKAASVFKTVSEGMVDTDVEKLSELTEDVDYDTDEQYAEKLNVIKNSYFKTDSTEVVDNKKTAGTNNPVVSGTSDSRMDGVMSAISHLSKK